MLRDEIKIYIPTMHRTDNQITYQHIPEEWRDIVYLVTVPEDVEELEKNYPGVNLLVPPPEVKGISKVRQWVLENSLSKYAWMMDDDQKFYKRLPNDWHLKYLHDKEFFPENPFGQMVQDTYDLITQEKTEFGKKFFGVGLSARQGNNNAFPKTVTYNTRMYNTYCLDVELFLKENIRFDEFKVMEDFNVTLSFLTRGYPNAVLYEYCWGQIESNMAGGCSEYRTFQVQGEHAEKLYEKFPKFVTVVEKDSKSWGEGLTTRKDVRVQWKKAFESSQTKGKPYALF